MLYGEFAVYSELAMIKPAVISQYEINLSRDNFLTLVLLG